MDINNCQVRKIVAQAIAEDVGHTDLTTFSLFPPDTLGQGYLLAKGEGVIAGLPVAKMVFESLDPGMTWEELINDGEYVSPGMILARFSGSLRAILSGERVALNFLQRLSGIATKTHGYVQETIGYPVKIVDTRKTTPGLRILEKYAVKAGGGSNHRFGLYDAVMLKDNHIKAAGSITRAVAILRAQLPFTVKIEVETENLNMVQEALDNKADIIMLDNMPLDLMVRAVELVNGKALVEASGGITMDTVKKVAATGVNIISVGELTHSVKSLDISLELD
ncbi:carboxylating nicotinate-nucleotide diphosphorylase [Desulfitibacter alkalitolerans]|uniref:carboxylating nicotinate-nucleotide diphosphorylase n=1 Tax=Desulfitibacter alkalitolerans TaxID=264641 RepID=UPI00047FD376|nr:carboxylating nicotinate-nucleotide diphosphorylase [Desulfitibacter alkalitolerans]